MVLLVYPLWMAIGGLMAYQLYWRNVPLKRLWFPMVCWLLARVFLQLS